MLRSNIHPLFKARGIRDPYHWFLRNDFPISAARLFVKDKYINIPLPHLERLCMLLHCTPNDVLSWTPPEGTDMNTQPMRTMMASEVKAGLEWIDRMGSMTLEELRALGKKIEGDL